MARVIRSAFLLLLLSALVWVGFRLLSGKLPPVDYSAAHAALMESGQPSAQEAENGYSLLDELCRLVAQRQEEINEREKQRWEADPADEWLFFGDERFRWRLLTEDPAELRDDLDRRMREVALQEYEHRDSEGFFDRVEQFARMRRYVPPPKRGLVASPRDSAINLGAHQITTLLSHRMILAADRGDSAAMEAALRQGLRIGQATQRGRTVIDEMAGMSQSGGLLRVLRELLITGCVPEGATARLLDVIDSSGVKSAMAEALEGERLLVLDDLQEVYSGHFVGPGTSQVFKLYQTHAESVRVANDRFETANSLLEATPPQRQAATDKLELLDAEVGFPVGMFLPSLKRIISYSSAMDTHISATRLMLLLQSYREREGAYPASLDQLVPQTAAALPVDPHAPDGRFGYRLLDAKATSAGAGYLLYSVGLDCVDNGGAPPQDDRDGAFSAKGAGSDFVFTAPTR